MDRQPAELKDGSPCWHAECSGTITPISGSRQSACNACGRRPPDIKMVTRSVVLFLTILGIIALAFLVGIVWAVQHALRSGPN